MCVYNFSPGPAKLPDEVLGIAQQELCNWHRTGSSVMEMSHRSCEFLKLFQHAKNTLRELLDIPDNYHILFLQGGARLQFSMVAMNLAAPEDVVDYVNSGHWSQLAMDAATKHAVVNEVASSAQTQYTTIPSDNTWRRNSQATYLHFVSNETIHGVQFPTMPTVQHNVPFVCDMSSDFLSRPIDVKQFGVIYAGAQKNMGIAGLTIVVIRKDLLMPPKRSGIPNVLQYIVQAETDSMYNTPPTFAIYMAGLVLDWLKKQGGVPVIAQRNEEKAAWLYRLIDESDGFYIAPVKAPFRSRMNVVFRLANEALNASFLKEAERNQLKYLKGHTVLGGMRASIYNAMSMDGIKALATFMQAFARTHC